MFLNASWLLWDKNITYKETWRLHSAPVGRCSWWKHQLLSIIHHSTSKNDKYWLAPASVRWGFAAFYEEKWLNVCAGCRRNENIVTDEFKLWFAASISRKCSWRHHDGIRIKHMKKLEGLQSCISVWWQHVLVGLLLLFSGESFSCFSSIRQKCWVRFAAFSVLHHCELSIFWVLERTGVWFCFSVTREVRKSKEQHFSRCTTTKSLEVSSRRLHTLTQTDKQSSLALFLHANMTSA